MRKFLLTLISIVAFGALVACGGGSSNNTIPTPASPSGGNSAGFSDTSLSGTYVFTASGIANPDSNSPNRFAVAGVFTANGSGTITSGTRDTVSDTGGQTLGEAITGTYSVNPDGRGLMTLTGSSQAIYPFVLSSNSAGSLFQDASTSSTVIADAVGKIELQTGTPAASGTYVVRLDGEDTSGSPYGAIGGLSIASGAINGQIDENDSGSFNAQLATTGAITLAGSRGNASFTVSSPISGDNNVRNFVVYYVSPNRLELLSTTTNFFLHGYADLQTSTTAFSGPQVFNLSGFDAGSSTNVYPLAQTGVFTPSSGSITSAIVDYDEMEGYYAPTFAGTYSATASAPGRWTAYLSGFSTGPITNENIVGWQVSPQQSILLVTYGANPNVAGYAILETGEMMAQTTGLSNANVTGNYAQALSGYDFNLGNFESTGNYDANGSGTFTTGAIDFQYDSEGFFQNVSESGTYSVDPTLGRGTATISNVPVSFYTVGSTNPSSVYMISTDPSRVFQGTLTPQ